MLGGASIFGGRGSFIGALLGALLLTEVVAAIPFLQIAALVELLDARGILILRRRRDLLARPRAGVRRCSEHRGDE